MNPYAIVTVATGDFYLEKQERQLNSFLHCVDNVTRYYDDRVAEWDTGKHFGVDIVLWSDMFPYGSKEHVNSPYGFKIKAMRHAFDKGYKSVLWLDSPAYSVNTTVVPLFTMIEEKGYYAMSHTDPLEQWASDDMLAKFDLTKEDIQGINLPSGSCYGFKMGLIFELLESAENNGLFASHTFGEGKWHRHDETILALILTKGKFPIFTFDPLFQSNDPNCLIKSGDI